MPYVTGSPKPMTVHHVVDSGPHSTGIGTTRRDTDDGPFQRARVVLHDQPTHRPVREMFSDAVTGQWQFHYLRPGIYYAIAIDPLGLKNGDIVTHIVVPTP